ncbi:MAG: hypothetical protein ACRCXX_13340 [Cetobacterium sp.]|uniref:hypothetical protein n=1 Tax=Cetobacterium sp. TaxID=2071632 RepID=UPI003F3F5032
MGEKNIFKPSERFSFNSRDLEKVLTLIPEEIKDEVEKILTSSKVVLDFTREDIENALARKYDNTGNPDYDMTSKEFQDKVDEIINYCDEEGFSDTSDAFDEELEAIMDKF